MSRTYRRKGSPSYTDYRNYEYIFVGVDKEYDKEKYLAKTFIYKDGRRKKVLTEKEYVYHCPFDGPIISENDIRRVFSEFEDSKSGVHNPPKYFRNIHERKHRRHATNELHKWSKNEDYVVLLDKKNIEDDLWWSWF